jgi:hypothetical protein
MQAGGRDSYQDDGRYQNKVFEPKFPLGRSFISDGHNGQHHLQFVSTGSPPETSREAAPTMMKSG